MISPTRPTRRIQTRLLVVASLALISIRPAFAQAQPTPTPQSKSNSSAGRATAPKPPLTADPLPDGRAAGERQLAAFRTPAGLKVELFAAEPQLGNPVAIALDERNRVFVAEEYRFNRGTEENRTRPFLLEDDLRITTLEQRRAMFEKHLTKFEGGWDWFTRYTDQVRLVEDRDGDGRADRSTVFATDFNQPLDGMAAGVIARDGDVWLTCIPKLWRLRDANDDGVADEREALLDGFGVNAGFLGHDLHGLAWGPDGKLYFSIGDRGFDVKTREGTNVATARRGAVFRCLPDGREFEVLHTGLRNPQEIAFDQYGNLFAADNNCDKGDHSRLVYVVEGGDSGWHMAFQTIPEPYLTGPWHAERMWHVDGAPEAAGIQPAWVLPPVGKLGAGPSGFTYYPGLGLSERYLDHFFMCNFTGAGGIESFALKRKGAAFEIIDAHDFLKPIMATDADFGYDGRMYVSDFVGLEWNGGSKGGRLYRVFDPNYVNSSQATEVRELFAAGFKHRENDELATLLRHADMRLRQRAQFALAERGEKAIGVFRTIVGERENLLARLHALWGLGQVARDHRDVLADIAALLDDPQLELRAHAARILGELRSTEHAAALIARLKDDEPRVRMFAALALGRLRHAQAAAPLVELLRTNADQDRYIRHAAVVALTSIGDRDLIGAAASDKDVPVRMAALLVMRRWRDSRIVRFLDDSEIQLVTEAARAIHDVQLDGEPLTKLAQSAARIIASPTPLPEPLVRRMIDANFKIARRDNIELLARIAAAPRTSDFARRETLQSLALLTSAVPRDRVNGVWAPHAPTDATLVREVLDQHVAAILSETPAALSEAAAGMVDQLGLKADETKFVAWTKDVARPTAVRAAALKLLAHRRHAELPALLDLSLADANADLRATARELLCSIDPPRAARLLDEALSAPASTVAERQRAIAAAATLKTPPADALLERWSERLASGDVPSELQLDVVEAATTRALPQLTRAVDRFRTRQTPGDSLARFRTALTGGDAARGREIFTGHPVAQCVRCHKVGGQGGDAGPELSQVGGKSPRDHLLESLVTPDAKIAPGFGSVSLILNDGQIVAGVVKSEDAKQITLTQPDGKVRSVPLTEIDERSPPRSLMPPMDRALSLRELRDLVEYLSSLR